MSSTVISKQNSSPIRTRRNPVKNDNNPNNRRSLSGRFRSLFQKNSSPNRSSNINDRLPPPAPSRQKSTSPPSIRAATEAPHLRPPIFQWPFGKKKTKDNRKIKSIEISRPIYQQEHQTSIRGQNFVPRTPELTHGAIGGTQSSSNYETSAKGFRDYAIIDNTNSSQQIDIIKPPPYTSDYSRSPSLNRQRLPDTSIEYSYHHNTSLPISDIEIIPIPKQHTLNDTSSIITTQILAEKNPTRPVTVTKPTNSNQWKNTSYSSLNNVERRSITSSVIDVDTPKFHVPLIPLSSTSSKKSNRSNSKYRSDETYNSSSTVNTHQPFLRTYGSLPDADSMLNTYPGLNAIIEHHIRPTSVHFQQPTPTSSKRIRRFDASTTTINDSDHPEQWSSTINNSSPLIHRHDGYIRPLTPEKSSIQPDVSMIHLDLDGSHRQSSIRTDPPIMYRSSTIIYTKDKHNYPDSGELRTWSIQGNTDLDNQKKITQIIPSTITNEQDEYERQRQQQYFNTRYFDNVNHSNFSRSSILNERDKFYDQLTRSYKDNEYTQESFNTITPVEKSEVALRHYTLKRTNSYDGLGIILSADANTHLNHRIRDVETGSPGSRIGLRKNDRIINVNGTNVENTDFNDVLQLIKQGLNDNHLQFSVS